MHSFSSLKNITPSLAKSLNSQATSVGVQLLLHLPSMVPSKPPWLHLHLEVLHGFTFYTLKISPFATVSIVVTIAAVGTPRREQGPHLPLDVLDQTRELGLTSATEGHGSQSGSGLGLIPDGEGAWRHVDLETDRRRKRHQRVKARVIISGGDIFTGDSSLPDESIDGWIKANGAAKWVGSTSSDDQSDRRYKVIGGLWWQQ
uniref:Uncharacterized protein n=1 Tax=Fagus sylvatica TaxID=28930 RepID=A0A2N9HW15_FAGSY